MSIQIKRGLQANVSSLKLAEGEFAVALDTGNVYIGTKEGAIKHINPTGGVADSAAKLTTARNIKITGDGTASATFDGTADANLAFALATQSGLTAGSYTKLTVNSKGIVTGAAKASITDITGYGTAATKDTGTSAGNVVVVGSDGKIAASVIPSIAIMDIYEAKDEASMLALTCQKGDICIRTDEAKTYILTGTDPKTLANWKWLVTPDCKVQSVNGQTGAVVIGNATTSAAGLMSAADKTKLDGVATGANKYVHPSYTAKAAGLYKVTVDATGHVSAATAVAKADITGLGIPAQDTTYSAASTSAAGLMSAADKAKLDGVASGANAYSLPAATASARGGVKVGSGLAISGDVLSVGDIDGGTF